MKEGLMKIGELARATGFTTKAVRYYELLGLLEAPHRSESGYRLYSASDVERLTFIKKGKQLALSLDELRDIIALHEQQQRPCVHVLALLDQKLARLDALLNDLTEFREDLIRLRSESRQRLAEQPDTAGICGIIERSIHKKGEIALAWLERRRKTP